MRLQQIELQTSRSKSIGCSMGTRYSVAELVETDAVQTSVLSYSDLAMLLSGSGGSQSSHDQALKRWKSTSPNERAGGAANGWSTGEKPIGETPIGETPIGETPIGETPEQGRESAVRTAAELAPTGQLDFELAAVGTIAGLVLLASCWVANNWVANLAVLVAAG
jgi:hypothetical protein